MHMKTIKFIARSKTESLLQNKPYPASTILPSWWKNMTPYLISPDNPDGKKIKIIKRNSNATFKKCVPMLDALTTGYIIDLWADVLVSQEQIDEKGTKFPLITWRATVDVFQLHGDDSRQVPAPPGYDQIVFKYLNCWIPVTPPGYSTLVVPPFGYRDLPFLAIPAVVDTDKSKLELVFPMWIKSNFEGLVENGTPLVQLIPFKRESWKTEFDSYEDGEYKQIIENQTFNKNLINNYIKNHWSKKTYK